MSVFQLFILNIKGFPIIVPATPTISHQVRYGLYVHCAHSSDSIMGSAVPSIRHLCYVHDSPDKCVTNDTSLFFSLCNIFQLCSTQLCGIPLLDPWNVGDPPSPPPCSSLKAVPPSETSNPCQRQVQPTLTFASGL